MVSKSAVYIYLRLILTAGVPPPSDGKEWSGVEWSGMVSKYLPTVESYGGGARFDLFFRLHSRCPRDSEWMNLFMILIFLSFLIKLK